MKTKKCKKCNIEKSIDLFFKSPKSLLGVKSSCKDCCKLQRNNRNEYLKLNRIKIQNKICKNCNTNLSINNYFKSKLSHDGFDTRCKSCVKKARNIEINNKYHKNYRLINNKKIKEEKQKYYQINKEEYSKKNKQYRILNREKIKTYRRNRYHSDDLYKINKNLRSRLKMALKNKTKVESTNLLIGCSIKFLKSYLELKFIKGMSWENYGLYGWHIDHIIPCSSFDLSNPEEQKKCFHYTNLQPLWAKDNLKKSNKLEWDKKDE